MCIVIDHCVMAVAVVAGTGVTHLRCRVEK
jgi:hypothetical protein